MQHHSAPPLTDVNGTVLQPLTVLKSLGIGPRTRVADFGAGHGHFAFAAAQLVGAEGLVYAIELQEPLVLALHNEAKSRALHNIYPIHADATILGGTKIPDEVVDAVLLMTNHVDAKTQRAMLAEAQRITKMLGDIIVIDWLDGATVPYAPAITARVSREETIKNAESLGLGKVDEFRPGRYHYGVRFHKR